MNFNFDDKKTFPYILGSNSLRMLTTEFKKDLDVDELQEMFVAASEQDVELFVPVINNKGNPETFYLVSNFGTIYNKKTKRTRQWRMNGKVKQVHLCKNDRCTTSTTLERLVWRSFYINTENCLFLDSQKYHSLKATRENEVDLAKMVLYKRDFYFPDQGEIIA